MASAGRRWKARNSEFEFRLASKTSDVAKSIFLSVAVLSALLAPVLFPSHSWAQKAYGSSKTFTAPDGAFTFRYSSELTDCSSKPDEILPKNCMAYFPVCGGETYDLELIACLAYPRNKYTETSAFEAATFSVGAVKAKTEKACLSGGRRLEEPRRSFRFLK